MVIDSPSDFHHKAYHKADYEYARMRTTIERIRDIRLQLLDFIIMYFIPWKIKVKCENKFNIVLTSSNNQFQKNDT